MKRILSVLLVLTVFCSFALADSRGISVPANPGRSVVEGPLTCPNNTIFSQPLIHPDSAWNAYTSDDQFPYLVYDNFGGLENPICDIHWWGLSLLWNDTTGWSVCDEDPMTFIITFYPNNDNNRPGPPACTYTVTLSRTFVAAWSPYVIYHWSTRLEPCCVLTSGWVSIQGSGGIPGTANCAFLWMTSPVGDQIGLQTYPDGTTYTISADLAFCLTTQVPEQEMDMGDIIHPLNVPVGYPTLVANPGHILSGVAWLGPGITGEPVPNVFDLDPADDGVLFPPFMVPCMPATVTVIVTAGPNYQTGIPLYLSAWKDGNNDGDFCDMLCPDVTGAPLAPEWIIQDVPVAPGPWTFTFIDPGLTNVPPYTGWFRFRLTERPVGPLGFGFGLPAHCPGTHGVDQLGEVEDYHMRDYQWAVELNSFDAVAGSEEVTLRWTTASETDNDYFELSRNGSVIAQVNTKGNTATGHSYEFVDVGLENGTTYEYELAAVDINGTRGDLAIASATPRYTAAAVTEYALHPNYPNPFNASTHIVFDMKESGPATIVVYDMLGRAVATLVNGTVESGRHELVFNAAGLPSGLYLCKFTANGYSASAKLLLLK